MCTLQIQILISIRWKYTLNQISIIDDEKIFKNLSYIPTKWKTTFFLCSLTLKKTPPNSDAFSSFFFPFFCFVFVFGCSFLVLIFLFLILIKPFSFYSSTTTTTTDEVSNFLKTLAVSKWWLAIPSTIHPVKEKYKDIVSIFFKNPLGYNFQENLYELKNVKDDITQDSCLKQYNIINLLKQNA